MRSEPYLPPSALLCWVRRKARSVCFRESGATVGISEESVTDRACEMATNSDYMVLNAGALHGKSIWCHHTGTYEVENSTGIADLNVAL